MKRHALSTRIWHWINAVSIIVLFMSGLNISNAHPYLYWGDWGFSPTEAWLAVPRFPDWAVIPGRYSLAIARDWHLLFSWVFALGLLGFMISALVNGHFARDLFTRAPEWRWRLFSAEVRRYLRFDFAHTGGKYGSIQKLTYALVVFVLLPLMILTGMAISPGMGAAWPWLLEVTGGRQSARSIHFLASFALLGFTIVHVLLVLLTGPWGQLKGMTTGQVDERGDAAA